KRQRTAAVQDAGAKGRSFWTAPAPWRFSDDVEGRAEACRTFRPHEAPDSNRRRAAAVQDAGANGRSSWTVPAPWRFSDDHTNARAPTTPIGPPLLPSFPPLQNSNTPSLLTATPARDTAGQEHCHQSDQAWSRLSRWRSRHRRH